MPVYNAERFVRGAVESILDQTYSDFEFIIVDDGSTDSSLQILRGYARADARIRLISRPNTGYAVALNEMIEVARGEYLARMDADDISLPDRFAEQTAFLRQHPKCVALGARLLVMDPDGAPIRELCTVTAHDEIDNCHLSFAGSAMGHPSVMMRKNSVRRVGAYRSEFVPAEDIDLWLRLAEVGQLANLSAVLVRYRLHPGSYSAVRRALRGKRMVAAVEAAHLRRGLPLPAPRANERESDRSETIPDPCLWTRMAFDAGNYRWARSLALKALRANALSADSWRVVLLTILGRRATTFARWLRH